MVLMLVLKSRPFGIAFVFETILFVIVKQLIEKMPTNREFRLLHPEISIALIVSL